MKYIPSAHEHEVLDKSYTDDAHQARANKRMERIVATPEEQNLYAYAPNRARGGVVRPGMPCEGYGEDAGKPGTAKD